jgi:hypothetical protein
MLSCVWKNITNLDREDFRKDNLLDELLEDKPSISSIATTFRHPRPILNRSSAVSGRLGRVSDVFAISRPLHATCYINLLPTIGRDVHLLGIIDCHRVAA